MVLQKIELEGQKIRVGGELKKCVKHRLEGTGMGGGHPHLLGVIIIRIKDHLPKVVDNVNFLLVLKTHFEFLYLCSSSCFFHAI